MDQPPTQNWKYLRSRVNAVPREAVLELAVRLSHSVDGNIIEFGVAEGSSTRFIRGVLSHLQRLQVVGERKKIFACDSFRGLPEKYEQAPVGAFACDIPVIWGVEIVEGYFDASLTPELARRVGRVALASLDADLYSSTICALRWLTPLLDTGSLLLFDEFIGEKESEKRALEEWSAETGVQTIKVAEFFRDPSGWGADVDKRALFQVVKEQPLMNRRVLALQDAKRTVRRVRNRLARRLLRRRKE